MVTACSSNEGQTPSASGGSVSGGGAGAPSGSSGAGGTGGGSGVGGSTSAGSGGSGGSAGSGTSSGGVSNTGGTSGGTAGSGTGGASGGSGGGGGSGVQVFSQCRFHFGAFDEDARNDPALAAQIDYFFPGWMGTNGDVFDQGYVCDETAPGGELEGKVPVVVSYVAAAYAKRHHVPPLHDCNAGTPHLCDYGAAFIEDNLSAILDVYENFAQGYANCYGTTRPIVFLMEPDFYQYTYESQSEPWTPQRAGEIMSLFVGTLREHLPNAAFSLDISPWVAPNNGGDNGATWYSHFDMSLFSFVNTSGGGTNAASDKIRDTNNMTWAGVAAVTGKPVLADTGYGVNGASAGHDHAWDNVANINARIADGVLGIAQYNPNDNWAATIASIRAQLDTPDCQ